MEIKPFSKTKLKQARLRRGFTQEDMAHELRRHGLKTNGNQVARWEKGAHSPKAIVIPILCSVLNVQMDELYGEGTAADDDEEAALLRDIEHLPEELRLRIARYVRSGVPA